MKTLLAALFLAAPLSAGNPGVGTTAANFLKLGSSARSAAMGEAYVALADDAGGLAYNPAGMLSMYRSSLQFTHTAWFKDAFVDSLYLVKAINPRTSMGGSFSFIGLPSQQLTTAAAANPDPLKSFNQIGNFSPFNMQGGVAVATALGQRFKVGGLLNVTGQSLAGSTAVGLGLDLGALYDTPWRQLKLGMALQNMGVAIPIYKESFGLPFYARLGALYRPDKAVQMTVEADMPNDNNFAAGLGLEFNHEQVAFLRLGLRYDSIFNPFSLGGGFRVLENTMIDLVWVPAGELGHTLRGSLAFNWGSWASSGAAVELKVPDPVLITAVQGSVITLQGLVEDPQNAASWLLDIKGAGGASVMQFSGKGAPVQPVSWQGWDAQGQKVPDGDYQARLYVKDAQGAESASATQVLRVNPPLPELSFVIGAGSLHPKEPGTAFVPTEFRLGATASPQPLRWRLDVVGPDGALFQRLEGDLGTDNSILWKGYNDAGAAFTSNSDYSFKLAMLDGKGKVLKELPPIVRRCVFRW